MHVYADRQIDSHTSKDPCTHACCHVYTHAPAQWHTIHRQSHGLSDVLIKGLLSFFPLECSQWKQPKLADKDYKLYEPVPEPRLVATWLRCREREVYRIESTSCEASYIRTEASGLFTSVGCLLGFRFSEQQDASSSAS
jgi:hypothetical protein